MNGWLKLHRELTTKAIWANSSLEQRTILITLLCMVNYEPNKWEWKGEVYEVKPGQLITSVSSIVRACNCKEITTRKVRTALERFEKLGFLTNETTNKNTLITIVNWEKYQSAEIQVDKVVDNQMTNRCQTVDKQMTTIEEYKNNKNVRNKELIAAAVATAAADTPSAISRYIKNVNPTASPIEVEKLAIWIDKLGDEVVICAIDDAVMCNHRNLRYIEKICDRCEKQGIKSAEAFAAQKEIYKSQKTGIKGEDMVVKKNSFNSYDQREYTDDELDEIIRRKNKRK